MTLVLCCHVPRYREEQGGQPVEFDRVKAALERHTPKAYELRFEDVSSDLEAYWRQLDRAWRDAADRGADLVVVEHDIVIRAGVFRSFARCRHPWCGFAYDLTNTVETALGCTRFRAETIQVDPTLVARAGDLEPIVDRTTRHWVRLDTKIAQLLQDDHDLVIHRHDPPVEHLNPIQKVHR